MALARKDARNGHCSRESGKNSHKKHKKARKKAAGESQRQARTCPLWFCVFCAFLWPFCNDGCAGLNPA